ncbi:MAG: hypothetical protein ABIP64_06310 [Burkholderiales bacterium]
MLTRRSYDELLLLVGHVPSPIWVNLNVLTRAEIEELRQSGVEVTSFTQLIDPTVSEFIEDALDSIREHHPNEIIWVENISTL